MNKKHLLFILLFLSNFLIRVSAQKIPYPIDKLPDTLYNGPFETVIECFFSTQRAESFESHPAGFKTEEEKIVIKEGFEGYQTPVYKTIKEQVLIREEHIHRYMSSPPVFETQEEKVVIFPARTVFVKQKNFEGDFSEACYNCDYFGIDTCHWKQITIPAKIRTLFRPILKAPPIEKSYKVSALYQMVYKQIIDREETEKQPIEEYLIEIPEKYQIIEKKIMVSPSFIYEVSNHIDPEMITIFKYIGEEYYVNGLYEQCGGN